MEKPTLHNFVSYEKNDEPDEDGMSRCYMLYGVRNASDPNSIYLWRNYNTFDAEPTLIPDGFVFQHNGYTDCDECNALRECCPEHIERRTAHLQDYRFGTKVFVEDYTPGVVTCPAEAEIVMIHDNGGRPFKVYVDHARKEVHIYSLNRNLIFSSKAERKDYTHTNMVRFVRGAQFQLAMNPKCSDEEDEEPEQESESEPEQESESKSEHSGDEYENNESEKECEHIDESKYYDQLVGIYSFEKVWIPDGLYLTRNQDGKIIQDKDSMFYGNSVLCHLGDNRYLSIGRDVQEFTTPDDEIQKYYSQVGNSDVPYPVAVGVKYVYFMLDMVAQPFAKYASLTEEQLSDAYSYFYGHSCVKPEEYESVKLATKMICKRDF
jgi:hypothetical protein